MDSSMSVVSDTGSDVFDDRKKSGRTYEQMDVNPSLSALLSLISEEDEELIHVTCRKFCVIASETCSCPLHDLSD